MLCGLGRVCKTQIDGYTSKFIDFSQCHEQWSAHVAKIQTLYQIIQSVGVMGSSYKR